MCDDVAKYLFSLYATTACREAWHRLTRVDILWSSFCLGKWLSRQHGQSVC